MTFMSPMTFLAVPVERIPLLMEVKVQKSIYPREDASTKQSVFGEEQEHGNEMGINRGTGAQVLKWKLLTWDEF